MADKTQTDAQGKTVVDRALLESKPRSRILIWSILTALLLWGVIILFPMLYNLCDGQAWQIVPGTVPFLIPFVFLIRQLVKDGILLRKLRKGSFTVTQDFITGRYMKNGANRTQYYIKGAVAGKTQLTEIGEREYYKALNGEPFWTVSLQTKKGPAVYGVYPGSSYTVSDELKPFYREASASGAPGTADSWEKANRLSDAATGAPEAPRYTSQNNRENEKTVFDRFTVIGSLLLESAPIWLLFLILLFVCVVYTDFLFHSTFGFLFIAGVIALIVHLVFFILISILVLSAVITIHAVFKKKYLIVQDVVAEKYAVMQDRKRHIIHYYIKGTAAADQKLPPINGELTYRLIKPGEPFWFVLINTGGKPHVAAVYPSSSYRPGDELLSLLRDPAETVSGSEADPDAKRAAQKAAMNELFQPADPKRVKCTSCGKKFNRRKHDNTCPRCGTVRIK